jgi:hypothetical protein
MYRGNTAETLTGTPQGGIVSPLLANIYLHELDRYMESHYLNLTNHQRGNRRTKGQSNFLYVRYADDFIVLCNGTKAQAVAMKEELKEVLNQMRLVLSEEKTHVTHITEGFDFLGYTVIRGMGRKGKMAPKVKIPRKALTKFQNKISEILAPNRTHESLNVKISALNALIRGWCEYYRSTSGPSQMFGKLDHIIFWKMSNWLGKKYDISTPIVMQRYVKDNSFQTSTKRLYMPSTYKAKLYVARTWHNPYTEPEQVKSEKERIKRESLFTYDKIWLGIDRRPERMDIREEVLLRDGPTCAQCKNIFHPFEVQVDHIKARARFKDTTEANRLENYQVLCTECHRAKTKSDLKVLSRVR